MPTTDTTRDDTRNSYFADAPKGAIGRLFAPVDSASLAAFRFLFGMVMAWEAYRYLEAGWVRSFFITPKTHFNYYGFSWVKPWSGDWMITHFVVVLISALGVALGCFYRLSAVVLWVSFTYTYLLDQALYLNHLYLASLFAFVMIFLPANRMLSIDALLWRSRRSEWIPAWPVWMLRAQVGLVYTYAGIAKLHPDWLRLEPIRMWLQGRSERTLFDGFIPIGKIFEYDQTIWFFAYGGLLFDLFIAVFLFWRRTRAIAFCFALYFHLTNYWLFSIGIFPWMMIGATLIFFEPDWPRRIFNLPRRTHEAPARVRTGPAWRGVIVGGLAVWFALQALVPLRHYLYPGDVHWTEEGHRFAWHMKLRSKSGKATFTVSNPETGFRKTIRLRDHLTARQVRKMATHPDMILQYAHYVAGIYREQGHGEVEVRVRAEARLNGRPPQLLIDPERDLAKVERSLRPSDWILPLDESVPPGRPRLAATPAGAPETFSVTPEDGERQVPPSDSPGDDE